MGSNIHISRMHPEAPPLKPYPEELGTGPNCSTLPRYSDAREFMSILRGNYEVYQRCEACRALEGKDRCDYYCSGDSVSRPKDFEQLRAATKHLDSRLHVLIDYLEGEPNAWLEYD